MTKAQIARAAALALASALAGVGVTATVLAQPGSPVVVPQSESTFLTGGLSADGGADYYNRSCGRVLDPLDAGIIAEPCGEGVLSAAERKCAAAYFACVVTPRVVKAAKR